MLAELGGVCPACAAQSIASLLRGKDETGDEGPEVPGYEIESLIGRGGMGLVFRCRRRADSLPVAIKLMPPHPSDRGELGERFAREAEALAALDHPHVLRIIEWGITDDERWFIVTELAAGGDLGKRLQSGALPVGDALRLFRQIVAAIAAAHEAGITHRDIKPANILLDESDNARVADFSLAKIFEPGGQALTLTQSTQVFGTPYYLPPEMRLGSAKVDSRADIFSLGVLLHEMLTGRLPIGEYVPASKLTEVPAAMDRLIARCLQEDPARRPQGAQELLKGLDQAASERGWKKAVIATAVTSILAMALGLGLRGHSSADAKQSAVASIGDSPAPPLAKSPMLATDLRPWENSLGMRFVPVPGTRVLFSIWETRRRDFSAFAQSALIPAAGPEGQWRNPPHEVTPDHPVTPVNLLLAEEFCRWLNRKEQQQNLISIGMSYRLPTDEEWSRAAGLVETASESPEQRQRNRGELGHAPFIWGRNWPPPSSGMPANFAAQESGIPSMPGAATLRHRDDWPNTASVGSFAANQLGIHDLSGNVSEWCSSAWNDATNERVLRGGSWNERTPDALRLDSRQVAKPQIISIGFGFRVVLELQK